MSLQRCEGKKLESVLEEVRNRFGDTVTIVEANRLRRGGVGGFFARERFEVVVDVADDDEAGIEGPPASVTELPAQFGLEATEDFCERLLSLADHVSDLDWSTRPGPPEVAVSTAQPEFAAVLDSITRHLEAEGGDVPPPVHASLSAPPAQTPPAGKSPALRFAAEIVPQNRDVFRPDSGTHPARPAVDCAALARLGFPEELTRVAAATPALTGVDPSVWLLGVLEHAPAPERLPQGPGSVIVVAGGRGAALALAGQMADEIGLDPEGLLIASPDYRGRAIPAHRRLTGVDTAAEARRSWRRRPRPTVVAVEATPGRSGNWARQVIDALEPTMVWGVVEATRKPEDLFEWAEQLGGFDALGVTDLGGTVSPAAVLQCGIPVGRLEGQPATPILWAALLAPRLAA